MINISKWQALVTYKGKDTGFLAVQWTEASRYHAVNPTEEPWIKCDGLNGRVWDDLFVHYSIIFKYSCWSLLIGFLKCDYESLLGMVFFGCQMMLAGTKTWLMVHGLMVHRAVNGRISVHWENTVESVLSYLLMLHPLYRIAPYCWQLHGEKPCRFV